jgi:hypothetical protein
MERLVEMRASRKLLATIEIPDYYIRQGETRQLRSYQKEAMRVLDRALELGSRRMPPFHLWRMADRTHPSRRAAHRPNRHPFGVHRAQHIPILSMQG